MFLQILYLIWGTEYSSGLTHFWNFTFGGFVQNRRKVCSFAGLQKWCSEGSSTHVVCWVGPRVFTVSARSLQTQNCKSKATVALSPLYVFSSHFFERAFAPKFFLGKFALSVPFSQDRHHLTGAKIAFLVDLKPSRIYCRAGAWERLFTGAWSEKPRISCLIYAANTDYFDFTRDEDYFNHLFVQVFKSHTKSCRRCCWRAVYKRAGRCWRARTIWPRSSRRWRKMMWVTSACLALPQSRHYRRCFLSRYTLSLRCCMCGRVFDGAMLMMRGWL